MLWAPGPVFQAPFQVKKKMIDQEDLSRLIGMSQPGCARCGGTGTLATRVCHCVTKRVFRACYAKYCELLETGPQIHAIHLDTPSLRSRPVTFNFRDSDFIADFELISKRTLAPDEWQIFKEVFLLGESYKDVSARHGIQRPSFFSRLQRIERKLGAAFIETTPYGLWPLNEYFGRVIGVDNRPLEVRPPRLGNPLRPPLGNRPTPVAAPVPVPQVPRAVPRPPFDPSDEVAARSYIRKAFSSGLSLRRLSNDLSAWNVAPHGNTWTEARAKWFLLGFAPLAKRAA